MTDRDRRRRLLTACVWLSKSVSRRDHVRRIELLLDRGRKGEG